MPQMPQMPHMAGQPGSLPEAVGPAVAPLALPAEAFPFAGRPFDNREPAIAAYPSTPQCFQPNAAPSPSFQDLCSPTYQSTEAYEQYVRDIMNADGDEFHFDVPRKTSQYVDQGSTQAMMTG